MVIEETVPGDAEGVLFRPYGPPRASVLVLGGSSGMISAGRARLFAERGALAASIRWFGGPGQAPGVCEVPLETFGPVLELLAEQGDGPLAVIGTSKGAEAAMLLGCRHDGIDQVIPVSGPSSVFANIGPGRDGRVFPYRSSWTWRGEPLPFVPYDESWRSGPAPQAYREYYERSMAAHPAEVAAAAIPVDRMRAGLILLAGADDQMWPSDTFAAELAERRRAARRDVTLVVDPAAGHRARFPGEAPVPPDPRFLLGGSHEADSRLGAMAFPAVLSALGLAVG